MTTIDQPVRVRLSHAAWVAATTHILASFAMLLLLRRGLPGFTDEERLAYITSHRAAWVGGWLLWQIAAISLIAFYGALALRFRGVLSVAAIGVASAGLAIDFICETRYIGVLPELRGAAFTALDRELEVLIGYAANGLYTVALVCSSSPAGASCRASRAGWHRWWWRADSCCARRRSRMTRGWRPFRQRSSFRCSRSGSAWWVFG